MHTYDYIVMGGSGLIGSTIVDALKEKGSKVLSLNSDNFNFYCKENISTNLFINANGNSYRFKANKDPFWDYDKSVNSLINSIKYFKSNKYVYFSSVDVYNNKNDPLNNTEDTLIDYTKLDFYGANKFHAETFLRKYHSEYLILRLGSVISHKSKKGPFYDLSQNKLFINKNSFLSVIDIKNIHNALFSLEARSISREIFNLTGTGNISLNEIIDKYKILVKPENYSNSYDTYQNNISNNKISDFVNIDSSTVIAERYFNAIYNNNPC